MLNSNINNIRKLPPEEEDKLTNYICKNCGYKEMSQAQIYLRRLRYNNPTGYYCFAYQDKAFASINVCRNHIRLYAIATLESEQGKGIGDILWNYIKFFGMSKGIRKITFRTSALRPEKFWYLKRGAKILKNNGKDLEMEVCY
jgi:GNAT superfamily N-acetyltransferase